jgi:adenosylcobinamide-GDP ribazoletransferase
MWGEIAGAFAFLTILPLRAAPGLPGRTFAWYPLVGLCIGVLIALSVSLPTLSPDLRAFLALLVWIIITGGLHLDGFADACDGLLATTSAERRLDIMKDPRTGSWAVIGLIVLLLGKWLLLREVDTPALLLFPPVIGRWSMILAVSGFPYARREGIGAYFREGLGRAQVMIATLTCAFIALLLVIFVDSRSVYLYLAVPLGLLLAQWATRRLGGGLTGDVYGAVCELTEGLCLLILVLI